MSDRGIVVDPDLPEDLGNPWLLGLVESPEPGHEDMRGRLAIPYLTPHGGPTGMKFRCLARHDCGELGHPKYLSHVGMGKRLFGVGSLHTDSAVVAITEGELDAIVATEAGVPSVAVPGVNGWQEEWRFIFEGFETVLIFGDGDGPGRKFADKLATLIPNARPVPMPDDHDVSSFVCACGADALREKVNKLL